jgi:hypothetical protein
MADYCSCGAKLPDDALFCHKCGKPQREVVAPEPQVEVRPEIVPPTAPLPPLAINFHNPIVVRIALLVAISTTVLSLFLPFVNWLAGGFFAVFLYRRKTGKSLNVSAGVRIGWLTGIVAFGLAAIVFTAQQLQAALSGKLGSTILAQMKNMPSQDPAMVEQIRKFIETGPGIAMFLFFSLAALFIFVTCLSMAGGAIGAKLVGSSD